MKFSIITPCTRVHNLPIIYKSLLDSNQNIEWYIIYDSNNIDYKILEYQKEIPIKLYCVKSNSNDSTASRQRNLGLEKCSGDYIYYLDDDNILHSKIFNKIKNYLDRKKLIFVNQFSNLNKSYRIKEFNPNRIKGVIDTAQIIIPKKYKHIKWDNSEKYFDEAPYIEKLLKESNYKYIFINRGYSYYNFLRRFSY